MTPAERLLCIAATHGRAYATPDTDGARLWQQLCDAGMAYAVPDRDIAPMLRFELTEAGAHHAQNALAECSGAAYGDASHGALPRQEEGGIA